MLQDARKIWGLLWRYGAVQSQKISAYLDSFNDKRASSMTESAEPSNGKSHRRRNLQILLAASVFVLGALLVWWKVNRSGASSPAPFAKIESATQSRAASRDPFARPFALTYGAHGANGLATTAEQGEDLAREKLAAMFKGRKPEVCGMTDTEAAEYVATGGLSCKTRRVPPYLK
jgi:hypothetical protein